MVSRLSLLVKGSRILSFSSMDVGWTVSNETMISPCKSISRGHVWLAVSALENGGT